MPHVSDVRATSHDRHDPMLVAALAADDLAGTDRDQAIALTSTCADCATLHDDLQALARATASAPPPIATRPRDFRLTPADAARLRPGGWRRLVAAASSSRVIFSRPLGAGLATLGLVGLLVGNIQISMGGSAGAAPQNAASAAAAAAAPAPAGAGNPGITSYDASSTASGGAAEGQVPVVAPAASSAAASSAPNLSAFASAAASSAPDQVRAAPLGGLPDKSVASQPVKAQPAAGPLAGSLESQAPVPEPTRPLNLLFGAAVIVGIALLLASTLRSRRPG